MDKKTVRDIEVKGKRVLVRVDFNVPLDRKSGLITDDTRIKESLSTIRYLLDNRARVVLMSHLGRPEGKVVESLRMGAVAQRLSQLLGRPVRTAPDCIGPEVEKTANWLPAPAAPFYMALRVYGPEERVMKNEWAPPAVQKTK